MKGRAVAAILALAGAACAHQGVTVAPVKAPAPVEKDTTAELIASADQHLDAGLAAASAGHLNEARKEFDRAVDAYLTAPGGAYADERRSEAYRHTLEVAHVRELEALAAGDGFQETPPEPASIDDVATLALDGRPSAGAREAAEATVRREPSDFPIQLNDAVLASIDLYQGKLHDWFADALVRGGRYLDHIRTVFAEEGIPRDLAYVALVESAFKTGAFSRARAKGVWQFMSATGRRYGLRQDWWVDERSNPDKATRAAARYLKDLHDIFGDWNLALAGYNAGERKVERGLKRYGVKDFWALRNTPALRRETRNYVPLIHAAILIAKEPELYGFHVKPQAPLAYERTTVRDAVDLRTVAECIEAPLDTVQVLNPALRRLATPAGRSYALKIPKGTAGTLHQCLDRIPPERRVRFRTHVVARGETLSGIARRYGTTTAHIAQANHIRRANRLSIGRKLIIPTYPPAYRARTRTARRARPGPRSALVRYRIKPGDTLSGIASQYGLTVAAIKSWNGLRSSRIVAGQVLALYPPAN